MLHHDKTGLLTLNFRSEALYWCNHHTNTHWQMGGFMDLCIGLTVMLGLNRWKKRQPNCRYGIMYMSRCLKKKKDLFHHLCLFCLKIDMQWKKMFLTCFLVCFLYTRQCFLKSMWWGFDSILLRLDGCSLCVHGEPWARSFWCSVRGRSKL